MPEWLMGTDCKSVSIAYVGSNPTRPNFELQFFSLNFKGFKNLYKLIITNDFNCYKLRVRNKKILLFIDLKKMKI